jgi:hypothetical protein
VRGFPLLRSDNRRYVALKHLGNFAYNFVQG